MRSLDLSGGEEATQHARRVLVIEDDLDQATSTVLLLRSMGHVVECALNGGAGIAAARSFRPDVVLIDVGLPDTQGWEVARLLREENPGMRLVAVTGRNGEADRKRSLEAGCEAHLVKPVEPSVYAELLSAPRSDNLRAALLQKLKRHDGA